MAPAGPSGKYSDANRELSGREHERHIDPRIAAVRISGRCAGVEGGRDEDGTAFGPGFGSVVGLA